MLRILPKPDAPDLLEVYGLREQPFVSGPDRRFAPFGRGRRNVLASLYFGVLRNRRVLTLTAAEGLGRTFLLHLLVARLRRDTRIAFLPRAPRDPDGLLHDALRAFGSVASGHGAVAMRDHLRQLARDEQQAGRRSVLIVDDAHRLCASSLNELEGLSGAGDPSRGSLQVVLVGLPALIQRLHDPELAALRQHVTPVWPLDPLSEADTSQYIEHRLRIAGHQGTTPVFTADARRCVAAATAGVPRSVDAVCRRALTVGCARDVTRISHSIVEEVLGGSEPAPSELSQVCDPASERSWVEPLQPDPQDPVVQLVERTPAEGLDVARVAEAEGWDEDAPVCAAPPVSYAMPPDDPQLWKLVQTLVAPQNGLAPRTILFVSVDQGAQTAQLCADVAKTLAAGGTSRVLVVGGDRTSSTLHEHFGVGASAGLAEILDNRLSIEHAMVPLGPTLSLLTAGEAAGPAASCLLPEQAAELMIELRRRFDYVLVDGMPLVQGSDGLVFSTYTEGVVLVVAAHATRRAAVRAAKAQLEMAGARVLGVILTGRRFPIPEAIYRRL